MVSKRVFECQVSVLPPIVMAKRSVNLLIVFMSNSDVNVTNAMPNIAQMPPCGRLIKRYKE